MVRVGIVGLGFMGKMHFRCYKALKNVKLVAICDIDENKFKSTGGTAGNISGAEKPLDFSGISFYTNFDKMLKEANLDAISITLPTYLHAKYTVKALKAGLNVLCEKPMATTLEDARSMIDASEQTGKFLMIAHNQRLAPACAKPSARSPSAL